MAVKTPEQSANDFAAANAQPVDTYDNLEKRSPDIEAMLEYWDLVDDLTGGINAMRAQKEKYLPKFQLEEADNYDWRLNNTTKFTNVYQDIVENLASKPFEEEVSLVKQEGKTIPTAIEDFVENVDGRGGNLSGYASETFFNGINYVIDWIFIDYPKTERNPNRTLQQAKIDGVRPYWTHVLGRNILEPKLEVINGNETLVYIRILEPGTPNHIREFERLPTGLIVWRLYEEIVDRKTEKKYQLIEEGQLTIDIIPLVPFMTGRRDGRTFKLSKPMQAAAELQVELYQQESGLKFAKTMTAYPMLCAAGVNPPKDAKGNPLKLSVGPNRVLYAPPDGRGASGSWSYVEPGSQSLTFLAGDIEKTIQQLRELGRQPLTAQSGNLTVITTAVAAGKTRSAVGAWALNLKNVLENALVITCKWLAIGKEEYDPQVNVYTEFDQFTDGDADKTALIEMRKNGDLSQSTLWEEMKRRRVLSPEFDEEEELKALLKEMPEGGEGENDDDPEAPPVKKPNPTNEPKVG